MRTIQYWLIKFAPFRYSWEDCLRNGKFEIYSVRNHQARNYLREMEQGDDVLFYHSQKGNCIMGRMKVIQNAHQDPTTSDPQWVSVTFEPVETFSHPVHLSEIKTDQSLSGIGLISQPRLAVVKLVKEDFNMIVAMGKQIGEQVNMKYCYFY